jgi:hypothetical protein
VATATVAEQGLINANQVMAFEEGSLWVPILDDGLVLRVGLTRLGNLERPPARQGNMRFRAVLVLLVPVVVLATACADQPIDADGPTAESEPTRYEVDGTVLESPEHGPELCVGGIADSLPPQCSGLRIPNWEWAEVDGEESLRGTTWGEFHLVGRYDGHTFMALDVGPIERESSSVDPVDTPCPEPEGGWESPDLSKARDPDLVALMRAVEKQPDFAGFWIDHVEEPSGEVVAEPGGIIANVAFVGDVEAHRDAIQELWGGPLCLVQHDRTYDELRRIQRELAHGAAAELGLEATWSGVSQHENRVELGVVVADDSSRMAVEERYGPGAVLLVPALGPVPAET